MAHLTALRSLLEAAQTNKEVLAKYGQSDAVLEVFGQLLDEFDAAVKLGTDGRAAHTGATNGSERWRSRPGRSSGRWMPGTGSASSRTRSGWGRGSRRVRWSRGR